MADLFRWLPHEDTLELLLVVSVGVSVASGAAWLLSRHLRNAALRHFVLLVALFSCFALPAMTFVCDAAELRLISIPVFDEQQREAAADCGHQTDSAGSCTPSCRTCASRSVKARPGRTEVTSWAALSSALAITQTGQRDLAAATAPEFNAWRVGITAPSLASSRGIIVAGMFVWAAGTALMLARLTYHCGCVLQLRRSSRPAEVPRLETLMQEAAARIGMRRVPVLLVSSRPVSPLAVGLGRPAVILPERLLNAVTDAELQDILAHEIAHLRRGDHHIVLLQELAAALFWPIASVHGLNRELWRAREELCDNLVLMGRDAISYSETLLRVAELLVPHRPARAAVGMVGSRGELERRIAGLVDPSRSSSTLTGRTPACVVACLFAATSLAISTVRFAASSEPPSATAGVTSSVPAADAADTADSELGVGLTDFSCCPS